MMKKLSVMTIVGTRPEIIRLSRVISKLNKYCDHLLVHTGQNYDYELNQIFFNDLNIKQPDYFLDCANNSEGSATIIGNIISKVDKVLSANNPDCILILGDTNSCLSSISAKRRKIPIFHMEAGNRCFDQRVPEEINRKIVDHISDINLTYSEIARDYLIREGLPVDQIIKIGSPMKEVLNHYKKGIDSSKILKELNLKKEGYFLVSSHREENINDDTNFIKFISILNSLANQYRKPIIVSTHPRTQNRINTENIKFDPLIQLHKPFGFNDYVSLQKNSLLVLSDSGTINEESSILNFPALNLRESHERPEAMEETSVVMTGLSIDRIFQSIDFLQAQPRGEERLLKLVKDYDINNVSDKVLRILHSYTDYINRVVWKKY